MTTPAQLRDMARIALGHRGQTELWIRLVLELSLRCGLSPAQIEAHIVYLANT